MKIGVLAWDYGEMDPDGPSLLEHGRQRGHEMSLHTLEEVSYRSRQRGAQVLLGDEDVASFDAVICRAKLFGDWRDRVERLSMVSDVLGPRMFDPAEVWVGSYSKFLMLQKLAKAGFPVPPLRSATSVQEVGAACDEWRDVIVKPSYGYRGIDVERITDPTAQRATIEGLLGEYGTLMCQPFYPTWYGEYRITVAGEVTPINMLKLPAAGTWRCKTAEDASFERFDAPDDLVDLSVRASRLMGLTLSGLDVLPDGDGYVILEVNPVPGGLWAFGTRQHQAVLAGVFDWVEKRVGELV